MFIFSNHCFRYANRDAELNEVGEEQSAILGNALRTNGILDEFDLAVVDEASKSGRLWHGTVIHGNGCRCRRSAAQYKLRTVCLALKANVYEHIFSLFARNTPLTGQWSSKAIEGAHRKSYLSNFLMPISRSIENLRTLTRTTRLHWHIVASSELIVLVRTGRYCHEAEVRKDGAWWHHGQRTSESHVEFRERAIAFKKWLGQYCVKEGLKTAVVVSHGGFLSTAFGLPKLHNCEMRAFDLTSDGRYQRVAADAIQESDAAKRLEIYTIHTSKKEGHKQYQLCGVLDQQPFTRLWRLSDVRTCDIVLLL